jgi:hypothetical protein
MPTYVMRSIQRVAPGRWDEKLKLEQRFDRIETRLGHGAVRCYQGTIDGEPTDVYVKEYEFDSPAAMDAALAREEEDPEFASLLEEADELAVTLEVRSETYILLPGG